MGRRADHIEDTSMSAYVGIIRHEMEIVYEGLTTLSMPIYRAHQLEI